MVTQYQAEFEKVVHETLADLIKRHKNPAMQAGFELFAASVIWAASGIKPHVPVSRRVDKSYKMPKR